MSRVVVNQPARPQRRAPRLVLGWRERTALPDWGIAALEAKIDTGARTSALHVEQLEVLDGGARVRFRPVLDATTPGGRLRLGRPVEAAVVRRARVRPSTGRVQTRFVVRTRFLLGPIERTIELSLVGREHMLSRMLLGRSALPRRALINPARCYLLTARPPATIPKPRR